MLGALSGCATGDSGQGETGSIVDTATPEPASCVEVEQVVAGDEVLPDLGGTPADIFAPAMGRFVGELEVNAARVPLELIVDSGFGEYRYLQRTWSGDPADPDAAACRSRVGVDFTAQVAADGRLQAAFSAILLADGDAVWFASPVPADQIEGELAAQADGMPETADLCFNAALAGPRWDGWLAWRTDDVGTGDEQVASFWAEAAP